jgi:hypothetical protein
MDRTSAGRIVRLLGNTAAFALLGVGIILPILGHEFAVFYFLFAILAGAAGDFLAIVISEGAAGLRPRPRRFYR